MSYPLAAIPQALHWLPQTTRYCCRCLSNRPVEGGRNQGGMFTCASCRGILETIARGASASPLGA